MFGISVSSSNSLVLALLLLSLVSFTPFFHFFISLDKLDDNSDIVIEKLKNIIEKININNKGYTDRNENISINDKIKTINEFNNIIKWEVNELLEHFKNNIINYKIN